MKYLDLFLTFARIGVLTFGGGYAMLPIIQREVVEKKGWVSDAEVMDYYAIGQCTPGVIAVNTATFTGRKILGNLGGIVATAGVVFPSVVIITVIAALIHGFANFRPVQDALAGIRVCVCVLIFNSVLKMWKKSVIDKVTLVLYLAILIASVFFDASPVLMVVIAAAAGLIVKGRAKA
ncbi:MAG TPA: chromate transporter [Lachnospiraceae bacterium]|nr:chromate transporter [Lachnospiraceae bacterium]